MSRRPAPPHARGTTPAAGRAPSAGPGGPTQRTTRPGGTRGPRPGPSTEPSPATGRGRVVARLVSVRAMVLGVVLLVAFSLLFPTVRAYLGQRAELDALAAEVVAAEERERELADELDRWSTDEYVVAQARARLAYALPGETAYRVIDPEVVVEEADVESQVPGAATGPALPPGGVVAPWYATVWESVRLAGEAPVPDVEVSDGQVPDGAGTPGDAEAVEQGSAP